MKRHVILMALLCLLFVFRGVMAVPQVRDDLVYNGEMQPLAADPDQEGGFYAIGSEDYWEEIPLEDAPGEWDIYWKAAEEDAGEFIGKAKISAKELTVTWGETTLEYNWDEQAPSVKLSGCVEADADLCENPEVDGAAYDVGEYEASLYFDSEFYFIPEASRSIKYEIKPKELSVEWGETTLSYTAKNRSRRSPSPAAPVKKRTSAKTRSLTAPNLTRVFTKPYFPSTAATTFFRKVPIRRNIRSHPSNWALNGEKPASNITAVNRLRR